MNLEDAEIGGRYDVTWDDCCVAGRFTATVTAKNYKPDPPEKEDFLESVAFDNGVTLDGGSYGYELKPISAGPDGERRWEDYVDEFGYG